MIVLTGIALGGFVAGLALCALASAGNFVGEGDL